MAPEASPYATGTMMTSLRHWSTRGGSLLGRLGLPTVRPGRPVSGWPPGYPPRSRRERLVVLGRVLLAACSLATVWLDPGAPVHHAEVAYGLLVVYLAYAIALVPLAWSPSTSLRRLGFVTQVIDLPVFAALIYLTEGPTSPFFAFFIFFLLCAALRWQWRGILWATGLALTAFIGIGLYAHQGGGTAFELDHFMVRSVYLVVVAALVGYLSAHEHGLRLELSTLAAWPRLTIPDAAPRHVLETAATTLGLRRAVLVWEDAEEPWNYVAWWVEGAFDEAREPPDADGSGVTPPVGNVHFLCADLDRREPRVLLASASGLERWKGTPLSVALLERFPARSVLGLRIRGEGIQGHLLCLDQPGLSVDDLAFGELVARQVAADMDLAFRQRQMREMAAAEEHLRLARELHDGLLQSLAGVALQLETARRLVAASSEQARQRLDTAQSVLVEEQRRLRSFIHAPGPGGPGALDAGSALPGHLEALGRQLAIQWNVEVEVQFESMPAALAERLGHHIYRIVQEAAGNAARHAAAGAIRVVVAPRPGGVRVSVGNDGGGFPFLGRWSLAQLRAAGLGPRSLMGRVAALGGDLSIESSPTGSRLEVFLPGGDVLEPLTGREETP